jgi:hypothetical protein
LILIETPSRDAQVADILSDPDRYFAMAWARAWSAARVQIDAELAERAERRLNHHRMQRASFGHP